ncbi:MAG: DUF2569 domain-containing protein [Candidatus Latescibacterota bacterium]
MPAPPRRIGGWLIIPAIELTVGTFLRGCWFYFMGFVWDVALFLSPPRLYEMEEQHPGYILAISCQMAFDGLLIVFQVSVATSFFAQRRILPRMIVILFVAGLAVSVFQTVWIAMVVMEPIEASLIVFNCMAAVKAAIWIPYFLRSKRVEATFVK